MLSVWAVSHCMSWQYILATVSQSLRESIKTQSTQGTCPPQFLYLSPPLLPPFLTKTITSFIFNILRDAFLSRLQMHSEYVDLRRQTTASDVSSATGFFCALDMLSKPTNRPDTLDSFFFSEQCCCYMDIMFRQNRNRVCPNYEKILMLFFYCNAMLFLILIQKLLISTFLLFFHNRKSRWGETGQ